MALGGAHSVDRGYRKAGKSWWPREFLSDDEVAYAMRAGHVDVMVCHDAPAKSDVPVLHGPSNWPEYDLACSAAHRDLIQRVVDAVSPSALYHGHYHCRYDDVLTRTDGGSTHVVGLAEDGTSVQDNALVLDLEL